jgi:predicted secreted Zn-dependent protease
MHQSQHLEGIMRFAPLALALVSALICANVATAQSDGPTGKPPVFKPIFPDPVKAGKKVGKKIKRWFKGGPKVPAGLSQNKTHFSAFQWKTYNIQANNIKQADQAIRRRGKYAAEANWEFHRNLRFDSSGKIVEVTAITYLKATIPSWPNANRQSEPVLREWNRYYAEVKRHEEGHMKIYQQHLTGFTESLVGMTKAEYDAAMKRKQAEIKAASQKYHERVGDRATLNIYVR